MKLQTRGSSQEEPFNGGHRTKRSPLTSCVPWSLTGQATCTNTNLRPSNQLNKSGLPTPSAFQGRKERAWKDTIYLGHARWRAGESRLRAYHLFLGGRDKEVHFESSINRPFFNSTAKAVALFHNTSSPPRRRLWNFPGQRGACPCCKAWRR